MAEEEIFLSVVAPAHNEEDNVLPLIEEIDAAIAPLDISYEIIIVDDGSTDSTLQKLHEAHSLREHLRIIKMANTPASSGHGQSAAFFAAFRAARGEVIAVLDADLQNDPADIPGLLAKMHETQADFVQGDRSHARKDTFIRRVSSTVSRWYRRIVLADTIRDTACSLRVMKREIALQLPLQFKGQHRYIPMTARTLGYTVVEMPVNHRPRVAGVAKYGIGNRMIPGMIDCFGVRWLNNRRRPVCYEEVTPAKSSIDAQPSHATASSNNDAIPNGDPKSSPAGRVS